MAIPSTQSSWPSDGFKSRYLIRKESCLRFGLWVLERKPSSSEILSNEIQESLKLLEPLPKDAKKMLLAK